MRTDNHGGDAWTAATNLLRMVLAGPRSVREQVRARTALVRARFVFRSATIGKGVRVPGRLRVVTGGRIAIGDSVIFQGGMIASELVCHPGAELVIGADCAFNYGVMIDATESVRVGNRCLFGAMSCLRDSDLASRGPIVLEDDVWVAHGAVIQPGVRIGAGSIVSAGSVVRTNVPPDSIATGNPAESFALGSDVKKTRAAFIDQDGRP